MSSEEEICWGKRKMQSITTPIFRGRIKFREANSNTDYSGTHTHTHLHVSIRCHIGFCGFFKILRKMQLQQLPVNSDSFGPGLILALHISALSCRLHLHGGVC